MKSRLHNVAVFPPGRFSVRVLIDEIDDRGCVGSTEIENAARAWTRAAITELAALPVERWHTRIVSSVEVEDAATSH